MKLTWVLPHRAFRLTDLAPVLILYNQTVLDSHSLKEKKKQKNSSQCLVLVWYNNHHYHIKSLQLY